MIKKLMVGSEGTFGFVSRATYNTVEDYPYKASRLSCIRRSMRRDELLRR